MKLWQRRTLGILAVGGGAIGIGAAITLLTASANLVEWLFILGFMALYAWGVWCGVRLLEQRDGAERSNLKYWLIQIPAFSSPFVGYFLSSGFHFTVAFQFAFLKIDFNVSFMLGSIFRYTLMQSEEPWIFGVNIFACGVAWWLARTIPRPAP